MGDRNCFGKLLVCIASDVVRPSVNPWNIPPYDGNNTGGGRVVVGSIDEMVVVAVEVVVVGVVVVDSVDGCGVVIADIINALLDPFVPPNTITKRHNPNIETEWFRT